MARDVVRVVEVVPDVPISGLEDSYAYLEPQGARLSRGDAVLVPFGGRTVVGYVISVSARNQDDFDFELKPVSSVIAGLSLPESVMEALEFLSRRFLVSLGAAVSAALPPGVRTRLTAAYATTSQTADDLTSAQREVLRHITERGGRVSEKTLFAKKITRTAMTALVKKGFLKRVVELPQEKKRGPKSLVLGAEGDVREFIEKESARKPAQAAVLAALLDAPRTGLSPGEIAAFAGVADSAISKLVENGLLKEERAATTSAPSEERVLTNEQESALYAIAQSLTSGDGRFFLLHGVTGSGKTEVYLRAAAQALSIGKRALFLVPEIALTAQVVGQLRERFGANVAVMHSGLAEGERLRHWRNARSGAAPVVIGARSAIFAPLENLGVIIVDEEHESSYKQDSTPRYHLRDLAEFRAQRSGATLVLGSATPSVETYYRAQTGALQLLELKQRATAQRMPDVTISDLRIVFREGKPSIIGPALHEALTQTFERNEQAILFINRRAYAHSLLCRDCGHVPLCPNCSVSLTFHRNAKKLLCHHCGLRVAAPDACQNCASLRLRPLGLGTERVEEALRKEFPGIRAARLDRDVARRKGLVEETFQQLRDGQLQALVGTQMIAKGLDFPHVTLVGVVAADTGLYVPDFRSTERTFQLLTQVAGRSGRKKPGRVVVQTFQPEHPAVRFAAAQDYLDFYEAEIEDRREARYPPFVRLINIIASSNDKAAAEKAILAVAHSLAGMCGVEVVGPADCPVSRVRGKYRKHVLLKILETVDTGALPLPDIADRSVQITVDVEPQSLL